MLPEYLETARLRLEPVTDAHIPELLVAIELSLPELEPWTAWTIDWDRQESESYLRNRDNPHDIVFAMVLEGQAIGTIGMVVKPLSAWADVGYWVRSDHAGKGFATEALRALSTWAFADCGLHRLELQAGTENHGSNRVAENAGFSRCGTRRESARGVNGWYDCHLWERLVTDPSPMARA